MKRWLFLCAALIALAPLPANAIVCDGKVKPVVVFRTAWCPYCLYLERFLDDAGVLYMKCDIEKDTVCADALWRLTHQGGVPATLVCREYVLGADIESIQMLLYRYGQYGTYGE